MLSDVGSALLVVDIQNDFVSGAVAVAGAERIIAPVNLLAQAASNVVVAMDWHPRSHISFASSHPGRVPGDFVQASYGPQKLYSDHCVQGTWGAQLDERLQLDRAGLILRKGYRENLDSFSAFHWNDGVTRTGLAAYLREREIRRVFVCGIARLGCVLQSALGATREGFDVFFVDDASIGSAARDEDECMALLHQAGVKLVQSGELG